MGVRTFLEGVFGDKGLKLNACDKEILRLVGELWRYKYAQHIVAELYGSLLSKCEFKTYVKDELKKADNYYKFNYEPNPNQSSSEFLKQLAYKLITECEALIIQTDRGNFYVADSYVKGNRQLEETWFSQVVVDLYNSSDVLPYELTGTFKGEGAIFIKYTNNEALNLMNNMNNMYNDLIENVKSSGSNKLKYLLKIDTTALNGTDIDYNEVIDKLVNEDFSKLVSENNTILPLLNGFDLSILNPSNNNSQNATLASTNISEMMMNVMTYVGSIYNVPKSFMTGTFEENDMDYFLTFGIDPFAELIGEAINRKFYTKKNVLDGTYMTVDTKKVKHFDILSVASAINKLISSGVYSINEVREMLDEKPIESSIGDTYWITRNYAVVGDYIQEQSQTDNEATGVVGGGLK